jgi:branched-chain amino acid transport system substrate-binding protein
MRLRRRAAVTLGGVLALVVGCSDLPDQVLIGVSVAQGHHPGAILAVEEINRSGGILGVPVTLYGLGNYRKQVLDARETLDWAQDFADQEDLLAVVGHSDSAATLVTGGLYNQLGLPQIATVASNASITGLGPWTYRLCLSDDVQGSELARYAAADWRKRRSIAVFVNDDYGRALAATFRSSFEARGGEVLDAVPTTELLDVQDLALVDSVLRRRVAEGFGGEDDVLVLFVRHGQAARILSLLSDLGAPTDILGGDALAYPQFARRTEDYGRNVRVTLFFAPDLIGPAATDFVDRYTRRFGNEPLYGAAYAYDATKLAAHAVALGGFSRQGVREGLESMIRSGEAFPGVTGDFVLNSNRDAIRPLIIGAPDGGAFRGIQTVAAR